MRIVTATITKNSTAIYRGQVAITGNPQNWGGYFEPSDDSSIDVGDRCQLKTADGRTGEIILTSIGLGSGGGAVVRFGGDGPLA